MNKRTRRTWLGRNKLDNGRSSVRMNPMKPRLIFCVLCAFALATPALAQTRFAQSQSQLFNRFDANRDGQISLSEYQNELLRAFDAMDANRNAVLDLNELPAGSRTPITRKQRLDSIAGQFRAQDSNRDGALQPNELFQPPKK